MPDPQFDILGFGAIAVDDLLYVEKYPPAECKTRVRQRIRTCGGLTGTALVAAARLGASGAYVGAIGQDELSTFFRETLAAEGVNMEHCAEREGASPGFSTIIVGEEEGTRNIFSHLAGFMGAVPDHPDAEMIRRARVLLVDHHGVEGSIRAARIAREASAAVVADFERRPEGSFDELLSLTDHPILPRDFALSLMEEATPEKTVVKLADLCGTGVITCGSEGVWYASRVESDATGPTHFPAFQVKAIDTTCCGDVFHGAYAAELALGKPLADRITFASAASAIKATRTGGMLGAPTRDEVEGFFS